MNAAHRGLQHGLALEQIKKIAAQFGPKRLMAMAGVALALLAALAFVATRGSTAQMGFLYTDLDPSAAAAITDKLKAANVPFQLSADGTSVLAPQDKLAELRMTMASDRLGGKIGYDILDQQQPFGISASREKLNETRAIEGELAKSIESLQNVSRARVHIVMPERAMFAAEARKATAAVTVKTQGRLGAEAVQSIRYLVASSVPELAPESISVVDQTGALLARAGEAGEAGASGADERQAQIEAKLRSEIEALLEPIVGLGKVRAEVSAQVDRDQTREEAETFDPDKQVIQHQITVESGDTNNENAAGANGASVSTQLPENQGAAGAAGGDTRRSSSNQNSEDTSYQNSSTHTVTLRSPGKVSRLSVAVMVDGGAKGLPQPMIQRLQRLVENAVGVDTQRGDSVVVESMPFTPNDALADKEGGLLSMVSSDQIFGLLKLLIIGVIGVIAIRMLKPKVAPPAELHQISQAEAALIAEQHPEMAALAQRAADGDPEAMEQIEAAHVEVPLLEQEIALAQVDGRVKLSALKRIGEAVQASPAEAASVIRQWMNA